MLILMQHTHVSGGPKSPKWQVLLDNFAGVRMEQMSCILDGSWAFVGIKVSSENIYVLFKLYTKCNFKVSG